MSTPMTPGSKSETLEDVIDLAWNNEGIILLNIKYNMRYVILYQNQNLLYNKNYYNKYIFVHICIYI